MTGLSGKQWAPGEALGSEHRADHNNLVGALNNRGLDVTLPPYSASSSKSASFNAGAVQDAITAVGENGVVFISDLLTVDTEITTTAAGQSILGSGLYPSTTVGLAASTSMTSVLKVAHGAARVSDLFLNADDKATYGLLLAGAYGEVSPGKFNRLVVWKGLSDGVLVDDVAASHFTRFETVTSRHNNGYGFKVEASSHTNGVEFHNCVGFQNSKSGLLLASTHGLVFGGEYSGNSEYGIAVGQSATTAVDNVIFGPWLEANTSGGGFLDWGAIRTLVIKSHAQDWTASASMPAARNRSNVIVDTANDGLSIYTVDSSGTQGGMQVFGNAETRLVGLGSNGLRLSDTKLGFFNTAAVAKPAVTGSTDTDKVTSIIAALESLGLVTDSTT